MGLLINVATWAVPCVKGIHFHPWKKISIAYIITVSINHSMMTSSNGNIFRITGPMCGEFTGPGEFPTQRPVTRSFDVSFDLRLNKRLSKQPWGWWFEPPSWSLWRHRNGKWKDILMFPVNYNDVIMSAMKSQITGVSTVWHVLVQAQIKENIKSPVNSLYKRPVAQKMFPFDDVIMKKCSIWSVDSHIECFRIPRCITAFTPRAPSQYKDRLIYVWRFPC